MAIPAEDPDGSARLRGTIPVALAAAATGPGERTAADRIDRSFLDVRALGYLGKQRYISLHIEDLPPSEMLLNRPPSDPEPGWTRPRPPDPMRPLAPDTTEAAVGPTADDEPTSPADRIDQSFIDSRIRWRNDFHAFANQLGYLGKQIYVGVNFVESLVASAVFNGTDMLRGEGVLKNLGEIASDVFAAVIWVAADELYLHVPGLPPIEALPPRAPEDRPREWRPPLPPLPGRDLVLPVWEGPEPTDTDAATAERDSTAADIASDDAQPPRRESVSADDDGDTGDSATGQKLTRSDDESQTDESVDKPESSTADSSAGESRKPAGNAARGSADGSAGD